MPTILNIYFETSLTRLELEEGTWAGSLLCAIMMYYLGINTDAQTAKHFSSFLSDFALLLSY